MKFKLAQKKCKKKDVSSNDIMGKNFLIDELTVGDIRALSGIFLPYSNFL